MKNQLLEDLDDSQSRLPAPPLRRAPVAPPLRELPKGRRAGVWRSRDASRPAPSNPVAPPRPPEPPPTAPRIEPELKAFSSRAPDWAIPPPSDPPWADRWGRKALGWTAGLGVAVALAATGVWLVRDKQVESTLAVVADHTPAKAVAVVPAAIPDPIVEEPPALRMLPPEPAPVAPVPAQEAPPPVRKPAAKPIPERRLAAATPIKRSRPAAAKKPARAIQAPVRAAPASRPITRPAPPPEAPAAESPLSETLRLCRAAGYHATACIKRGCEATRFGLVCRG